MLLATAACKHILIYDSQQPSTRDVNASLHDLHDYYLRPWRACATVAHSASMMCSYGSFNGLPDCLHKDYITDMIRDKWNWTGFVVSVSFQWKNPDFLLRNPDFLLKKRRF